MILIVKSCTLSNHLESHFPAFSASKTESQISKLKIHLLPTCRGRAPSAAGTGPEQANRMKSVKAMATPDGDGRGHAHPFHLQVRMRSSSPKSALKIFVRG